MYCKSCGSPAEDGAKFCKSCGAQRIPEAEEQGAVKKTMEQEGRIGESIVLCSDGKYRWERALDLFRDLSIYFLVWKIFVFIFLGIFAIMTVADFSSWGVEHLLADLRFLGIFLIGMTVVTAVGYAVYGAIMGGKYRVIFEMDENGVNHRQVPAQAKKAKMISELTMAAGVLSGNLTTAGVGMNAGRTEMYTAFDRVRKVKLYPRRGTIKLTEGLSHNQVYASKEDFAFVRDYILSRCPGAKIR